MSPLDVIIELPEHKERLWFELGMWTEAVPFSGNDREHIDHLTRSASQFARSIAFRNFWTEVRVDVRGAMCAKAGPFLFAEITVRVRERDTGEPTQVRHPVGIHPRAAHDPEVFARAIRQVMLERVCAHELDEALHLEGRRVFDPHGPFGRATLPRERKQSEGRRA